VAGRREIAGGPGGVAAHQHLRCTDLVTWERPIGFTSRPGLAHAEITTYRCCILHVTARITRGARRTHLRIDATWQSASQITYAWQRIRSAFG